MAAVNVGDGCIYEFLRLYVFKTSDADPVGQAATLGGVPDTQRANPQCLQNRWRFFLVLNKYSVSSDSPANRRKESGLTIGGQERVVVQMVQLHLNVPWPRSMSASKRTAPQ